MRPTIVTFYTKDTAYEDDFRKMESSAIRAGFKVMGFPIPKKDDWVSATNMKPKCILRAMRLCETPVLFIDSDCWFIKPTKFFDSITSDMCLDVFAPNRLRKGMSAQQYKHHILTHGCMWNSGILYLANNSKTRNLVKEWVSLSSKRVGVWDQINLQKAWLSMEEKDRPSVSTLPDDHVAGRSIIGHDSGFHRHWNNRQKPRRKVLLLGSAPYIEDWWKKNGERYLSEGWTVAAMNNAWRVPSGDLLYWMHPDDFPKDNEPPRNIVRNSTLKGLTSYEQPELWNRFGNWMMRSHWHCIPKVCLTFIDSLHHLLNEAVCDGVLLDVAVAGSDLIYPKKGATHFYGKGTPDPLRFEGYEVEVELNHVMRSYELEGCRVVNVGGARKTALPFPKHLA